MTSTTSFVECLAFEKLRRLGYKVAAHTAQADAGEYLQGVTEVLAEAHKAFAESVERTLRKGNADFHRELADAVNLLKGAIQDLGDTLDAVVSRR